MTLHLEENSLVLDTLFRFLYPNIPKRSISDISEAVCVIEAAHKYELDLVLVHVGTQIEDLLETESNAVRAWAIAKKCANDSARRSAMLRYLLLDNDEIVSLKEEAHMELNWCPDSDCRELDDWRKKAIGKAFWTPFFCSWTKEHCYREERDEGHDRRNSDVSVCRIRVRTMPRSSMNPPERVTFVKALERTFSTGNPYKKMQDVNQVFRQCAEIAASSCGCEWCVREPETYCCMRSKEIEEWKKEMKRLIDLSKSAFLSHIFRTSWTGLELKAFIAWPPYTSKSHGTNVNDTFTGDSGINEEC